MVVDGRTRASRELVGEAYRSVAVEMHGKFC